MNKLTNFNIVEIKSISKIKEGSILAVPGENGKGYGPNVYKVTHVGNSTFSAQIVNFETAAHVSNKKKIEIFDNKFYLIAGCTL